MPEDFDKPVTTDGYSAILASIRGLAADQAKMFDGTGTLHSPTGTVRWTNAASRFEKWNGSAWAALAVTYAIDVATVGGKAVGHGTGEIPYNDGVLNSNLNAGKTGGAARRATTTTANALVDTDSAGKIPGQFLPSGTASATPPSFAVIDADGNLVARAMADVKSDLHVLAGAARTVPPATYGSVQLAASAGGWTGFEFEPDVGGDNARSFISQGGYVGVFEAVSNTWDFKWFNGVLQEGSVPWARITGAPSLAFLPLAGGTIAGSLAVTGGITTGAFTSTGINDAATEPQFGVDDDGIYGNVPFHGPNTCKAFARFSSGGTLAASYNVSSITVHSETEFAVNFATAMTNTTFAAVVSCVIPATYGPSLLYSGSGTNTRTVNYVRFTVPFSLTFVDPSTYYVYPTEISIVVFGG